MVLNVLKSIFATLLLLLMCGCQSFSTQRID